MKKNQEAIERANETILQQYENSLPPKTYNFENSDLEVKWHVLIFDLLEQTYGYTPNVAGRNVAYIDLAAYEAILPAFPNQISLSGQIQGYYRGPEYDISDENFIPEIAMNSAIYSMVDKMFQTAPFIWMEKVIALKNQVETYYRFKYNEEAMVKSQKYGESVASLIYEYSISDGGFLSFTRSYDINYELPVCDACFTINRVEDLENTGPMHPKWGKNRTFVAENQGDFDFKPKVEFSKEKGSPFYEMAMEVYNTSKTIKPSDEKYQIANFWDDAAGFTYTAHGHSMAILTQVLRNEPVSTEKAAEIFCQLSLALNDACICAFESKYNHNLIRPVAYINNYIDPDWKPILLTPPFPEFPSGHSVQSAAMAQVLTARLGENINYTDYSKFWTGKPRKFTSFWQAADEVSISRLYGGIHFIDALDQGQEMGKNCRR